MQILADFDTLPVVHCQQLRGGAADRRATDKRRALPREMIRPEIPTWMEQRNKLPALGIEASNVRPLVEIATATGQRQIVGFTLTAMLTGDDMLDVKADDP